MFHEPIHIIGAGSVGMLWASAIRLTFPNYPVQLLLREGKTPTSKERTICRMQDQHRPRIVSVPCGSPLSDQRTIRNLIVTTKAYDANQAVRSVEHRLDPSISRIIVLCNGALAVADSLRRDFKGIQLHTALTSHGVYKKQPDNDDEETDMVTIFSSNGGHCYLHQYEPMRELWNTAGLDCRVADDMELLLWRKLAANCVINPLTALYNCTNGELPQKVASFYSRELPLLLQEVQQVYQAESGQPHADFEDFVRQVLTDTEANRSSMLVDVESCRQTEIDFLNGYVVQKGLRHGIQCKLNHALWDKIRHFADREQATKDD